MIMTMTVMMMMIMMMMIKYHNNKYYNRNPFSTAGNGSSVLQYDISRHLKVIIPFNWCSTDFLSNVTQARDGL